MLVQKDTDLNKASQRHKKALTLVIASMRAIHDIALYTNKALANYLLMVIGEIPLHALR